MSLLQGRNSLQAYSDAWWRGMPMIEAELTADRDRRRRGLRRAHGLRALQSGQARRHGTGGVVVRRVPGVRPPRSIVRDWMGSGVQDLPAGEPGRRNIRRNTPEAYCDLRKLAYN